jgi:hypothetical protein
MNDQQLEEALQTWPLAEVPPDFTRGVMARIQPRRLPAQALKFRLTWMDFALGAFFSLLPPLVWLALRLLPAKAILYIKYQWLLLQSPAYAPWMFLALGAGGLLLGVFLIQSSIQLVRSDPLS